jgi:hypothetical protein
MTLSKTMLRTGMRFKTTHFHMAFLLLRGNIVAVSTNQIGSRSRGAGYSDYTLHAERAVMKQMDVSQLKNMTLVGVRIQKELKKESCIELETFSKPKKSSNQPSSHLHRLLVTPKNLTNMT